MVAMPGRADRPKVSPDTPTGRRVAAHGRSPSETHRRGTVFRGSLRVRLTLGMRRVLILGGTAWLGRETARLLVGAGAEVTCVARGRSGSVPDGVTFVRADRSRPGAFDAVTGEWDEVIELAYAPEVVGPSLEALARRAAHWTLISTVSVYARNDRAGDDESATVVEPVELSDYGQAKVAAERASAAALGDRLLILRPGLIAGPGDPSDRFGYWPIRLARGGAVLTPVLEHRRVQVIDIADLAAFVVRAGRQRLAGVINAVGSSTPMADFFAAVAAVTGFSGRLVQADDEWLLDHDVHYWMGPRSLPLWLPATEVGFATRANEAFLAAGGSLRPLPETIARALGDERRLGDDRDRRSGLTPDDEAGVMAELAAR